IDARRGWQRNQVRAIERTKPTQVEDRPQVDEERVVALASEDRRAVVELMDSLAAELVLVVRRGAGADVDRRYGQVAANGAARAVLDPSDTVGLRPVPVRIVRRADRPGVVQEGIGISRRRFEAELVADVVLAIADVVDIDRVQDVVAEGGEVRSAGR